MQLGSSLLLSQQKSLFKSEMLKRYGVEWRREELNLRPTVSRPVRLGIGPPFEAHDQILHAILSDIHFLLQVGRPI
jgi:hypothetical protein